MEGFISSVRTVEMQEGLIFPKGGQIEGHSCENAKP